LQGQRRKASPQKGPAGFKEHASCAAKKVIGTQAGLPARLFISLCGSGKNWGKLRDDGNACGIVSGVENGHSLFAGKRGRKRPPV